MKTSILACLPAFFLKKNPRGYTKILKIPIGLKLYRRSFFNSRCKSHDKYVAKILRKFGLTDRKSASTPIDTNKPLLKDPDGEDVDVHTYRKIIGSLMYLTSSRPDIMFVVCACAHFQVTPKASHLHAVTRIFRGLSILRLQINILAMQKADCYCHFIYGG
nr:retrovirus-related Pol polyprotein from transposon TNT 1-94 [Tanacetum cinerariifolium]